MSFKTCGNILRCRVVNGGLRLLYPRQLPQQIRFKSGKASLSLTTPEAATKAEIESLRAEIKNLQQLVQQTYIQSKSAESLAHRFEAQSETIQKELNEIHQQVVGTSAVERMSTAAKDYVQHNEALTTLLKQINKHSALVNKYTLAGLALFILVVWWYRASISQRTSEEVADLASRTLQQETLRQTIRETLDALASSPETLETLNELLQRIIRDPSTVEELVRLIVFAVGTENVQTALLDLLQVVFKDPHLQELSGEFLLKGLDVQPVREMLEAQTQALVRATVLDETVQEATSVGVQKSLWMLLKPPFFRNNGFNKDSTEEAQTKETNTYVEPPSQ